MAAEDPEKATARARVAELVRSFQRNEADYLHVRYNETQARTEFITPLLVAFGWDVHNRAGHSASLREVIEEATLDVGEGLAKKPDYELRLARQRKLFVEAKKPHVTIATSREAAFQTRRYGYSASLPIAVLTSFHELAIYDCLPAPVETDEAHVARLLLVRYDELDARFDELWPLLSRQAVYSGEFDRRFAIGGTRHGADQFDDLFLRQVRSWRERLAVDIHAHTPGLSAAELTYAVQLFLSRIVFLRICEDRDIERYETLKNLPVGGTFDALITELRRADAFYDSGLFHLLNDARLGIKIGDAVLHDIIAELYYPQSPYTFAVVEAEVLGEIYEQFLGEEITITAGVVAIVRKPEIRESGGVVTTPRYIVDAIVARTLGPALRNKSPAELADFTVLDMCCGSGIFLLSIYEYLLDHYLSWYLDNQRADHIGRTIYEGAATQWRLTFEEKRRILCRHIRGVDIDANAVEVAQFSLLLKLIEDENGVALADYVTRQRERALPDLSGLIRAGNSLVSLREWATATNGAMPTALVEKVNPFDWQTEFPTEMARGGFSVIVGNPPYIRIQNMTGYSAEEADFYQRPASPYSTAQQDNFDKYALFIERALTLVQPHGRLGVITPHKFMTIRAGRSLRRLLTIDHVLEEVVHFGVQQAFGRAASTYTCILVVDKRGCATVRVEQVRNLEAWRYGATGGIVDLAANGLGEDAWQFANAETQAVFARVRAACPTQLGTVAEIFVGVQTSADDLYIFRSAGETTQHHLLRWDNRDWPIEKDILRPVLLDVSFDTYARPRANAWLIFPYEFAAGRSGPEARLIQPAEMMRRFPNCMAYLDARRAELDRRAISGGKSQERQFYQFGRSQSLVKFNSPKIILPALSREARYAYDDDNLVVTGGGNGPYYLVRQLQGADVSDRYLLAVLNHPVSEAFVRTNTSSFRGGYYSHGKQFIAALPIPIPSKADRDAVEQLVVQLSAMLEQAAVARTPHQRTLAERQAVDLRAQIDNRITALFGFNAADMDVIRAVPVPD